MGGNANEDDSTPGGASAYQGREMTQVVGSL